MKLYKFFFKPVMDFVVAFTGLLLLNPTFLFVTLGLAFANNGKPFFFQLRPGKSKGPKIQLFLP
ncbi:MAG TPA: hypothetical protein VIN72_03305 [Lutibacter sp.]